MKNIVLRRQDVWRLSHAELFIRDALVFVEEMGADPLLTEVTTLLQAAKEKLADYVDDHPQSTPTGMTTADVA